MLPDTSQTAVPSFSDLVSHFSGGSGSPANGKRLMQLADVSADSPPVIRPAGKSRKILILVLVHSDSL